MSAARFSVADSSAVQVPEVCPDRQKGPRPTRNDGSVGEYGHGADGGQSTATLKSSVPKAVEIHSDSLGLEVTVDESRDRQVSGPIDPVGHLRFAAAERFAFRIGKLINALRRGFHKLPSSFGVMTGTAHDAGSRAVSLVANLCSALQHVLLKCFSTGVFSDSGTLRRVVRDVFRGKSLSRTTITSAAAAKHENSDDTPSGSGDVPPAAVTIERCNHSGRSRAASP